MKKLGGPFEMEVKHLAVLTLCVFFLGYFLGISGRVPEASCSARVNAAVATNLRLPQTMATENARLNAALRELQLSNRDLQSQKAEASRELQTCQQVGGDEPDLWLLCEEFATDFLFDNYRDYCEADWGRRPTWYD